jgi:LAO/AO transport system kinase
MTTPAESIRLGDRGALARLITLLEEEDPAALRVLAELHPQTGRALIVGVTGAPGTGKSTLVNALAREMRKGAAGTPARTVGIIAVDPSSPFSGGALLGDRIRMRDLAGDEGVFIRSMASRGELGGLSRATDSAVRALDSAGFDVVLIETVGAGQDEIEIARQAHTVIVVETPGLGDEIQAIKAGILEIADVLALNKADLAGADSAANALQAMLDLGGPRADGWRVPVLKTVASAGEGVADLAAAVLRHNDHLHRSAAWEQRERTRIERNLEQRLRARLMEDWRRGRSGALEQAAGRVAAREVSPEEAVEALLADAAFAPGGAKPKGRKK